MKVEKIEKIFNPVTITIETKKEAELLRMIFGHEHSVAETLVEKWTDKYDLDAERICQFMKETNLWEELAKITDGKYDRYFS